MVETYQPLDESAMPFIQKRSILPLYYQLFEILREQIRSGDLGPGGLMPSERELMQHYTLSRNTVRQALDVLDKEGLIVRDQGHGTYVSNLSNTFHYMLDRFLENPDLLRRAGYSPSVRQISSFKVEPPEPARDALHLHAGEEVLCHTMIFYAENRPAMYTQDYLPVEMTGEYDLSPDGEGFMKFLDRTSGLHVEYVLVDISPVEANGEIARIF